MSSFCYSHFFSKKFQHICISLDVNFNELLTNDIVSFEQLGPGQLTQMPIQIWTIYHSKFPSLLMVWWSNFDIHFTWSWLSWFPCFQLSSCEHKERIPGWGGYPDTADTAQFIQELERYENIKKILYYIYLNSNVRILQKHMLCYSL